MSDQDKDLEQEIIEKEQTDDCLLYTSERKAQRCRSYHS